MCRRLGQSCEPFNLKVCPLMAFGPTPRQQNPTTDIKKPRGMTIGVPSFTCAPLPSTVRVLVAHTC